MEYGLEITQSALGELKALRAFDRRQVVDAVETQLRFQPGVETKKRKPIRGAEPSFEHVPPIWELRVGDYRVFYDIDEMEQAVFIRAVREKPPHATTESIL